MYMRFKDKMSYIWDLNNWMSNYLHVKIKLHIYVVLALKSHIWHVLNHIHVDLYFSDVWKRSLPNSWQKKLCFKFLCTRHDVEWKSSNFLLIWTSIFFLFNESKRWQEGPSRIKKLYLQPVLYSILLLFRIHSDVFNRKEWFELNPRASPRIEQKFVIVSLYLWLSKPNLITVDRRDGPGPLPTS